MDSTLSQFIDSTVAQAIAKTEPNWVMVTIVSAIVAGIVSIIIWLFQSRYAKKQKEQSEREQLAKVWGLALFELREAINRSLSYEERFNKGIVSLCVLYFSKTVASDYFKFYSDLPVAIDMHWLYAMLNQVQQNLETSRITDEAGQAQKAASKNQTYTPIYAGAAAGFIDTHKNTLISKFNSCLQEWNDFCRKYSITIHEKKIKLIEKIAEV